MNREPEIRGPVLVTGAASGIGAATVDLLVEDGVEVIAVDRTAAGGSAHLPGTRRVVADLTEPAGRTAALEGLERLGGLVHCAGVIQLVDPAELTEEQWDFVLDTNLKATFFLLQAALPLFEANGAVVLLSSAAAKVSSTAEAAAYGASKAGVLALTRSFANYLAPRGVRVNAICPGLVDTAMQDKLLSEIAAQRGISIAEVRDSRAAAVPMGREARPDEIAGVACHLLSDRAGYMTGQSVNVDGGMITQ